MLRVLRTRAAHQRKAGEIYGAIVTQARRPEFYANLGVPDTPVGRYEMVVIHLFLVLERLRDAGAKTLQRALIEAFVSDMDDSVRELGTGDTGVARKVRRAAAGLYDRMGGYRAGLAEGHLEALQSAFAAHELFSDAGDPRGAALAAYMREAADLLAALDATAVSEGQLAFPIPPAAERGQ